MINICEQIHFIVRYERSQAGWQQFSRSMADQETTLWTLGFTLNPSCCSSCDVFVSVGLWEPTQRELSTV
jgi:hypothetical protein